MGGFGVLSLYLGWQFFVVVVFSCEIYTIISRMIFFIHLGLVVVEEYRLVLNALQGNFSRSSIPNVFGVKLHQQTNLLGGGSVEAVMW